MINGTIIGEINIAIRTALDDHIEKICALDLKEKQVEVYGLGYYVCY
jgi:hypothetical protein